MDLMAGAMGNLAPKLLQLLRDEYKLQTGVKAQVKSLADELGAMHLALCKVADVPYDQLDPQVKLWASEAREEEYDMEDVLDNFLVSFDGGNQTADADKPIVSRFLEVMGNMFSRFKARHEIASTIEDIKKRVDEIARRRKRYKIDDVVANSTTTTSIDPRLLMSLRTKASELVSIDERSDALIEMLTNGKAELLPQSKKRKINMLNMGDDDASSNKDERKIVSIVGPGGLGKTTLAKVVYEKLLTMDKKISCNAFVPVGRNPDLKKVLRDILIDLNKSQYMDKINFLMILDERQLVEEIQGFLIKQKRYFIVIDDIWDVPSWNMIRTALLENNSGSKIMITTCFSDVAELVHYTYKIQPLSPESSKILFCGRIFGSQDRCPERFSEISDKILKKCDGVPLAIVTIASLLANKSGDITEWQEVCNSIGSGLNNNNDMFNDMRKILSLSYYDLPSPMKTCFLYLSMYPEDYEIDRDQLIWRWICEGFIQLQRKGDDLFEIGKSYFNDLINRCLIQPIIRIHADAEISGYRVHDMILDLICSLSREENFVTTSDDIDKGMSSERKKLRRLSLKSTSTWPKKGVSHVRSIAVFWSAIDSMLSFSFLDMLHVLDLEGCSLEVCGGSKLCIGNLVHLRYLCLSRTGLKVLPGGIEKLHSLLVLKVDSKTELQESIFGLRQLMCLQGVLRGSRTGYLLRNLASLQVLDALYVGKDPAETLEALGHLTQLKRLSISMETEMVDQRIRDTFIDSLNNLRRLQYLCIGGRSDLISWERWAPPPHLSELIYFQDTLWPTFPKWLSPASVPHLAYLHLGRVHTIGHEDIQILGMLPNLVVLWMSADRQNYLEQPLQKFMISADTFPRLRTCLLFCVGTVPSMFTRGAMPRVELFYFCIRARDFFSNHAQGGLDFDDLAMDHLPSLRIVQFVVRRETDVTEEEATKLEEAVKNAAALGMFGCLLTRAWLVSPIQAASNQAEQVQRDWLPHHWSLAQPRLCLA